MADADTDKLAARRPLSPHLTIFKPILTMMMSIAHRITGAGLYVGMALLTLFLL
ncbi:MAG: succinate:quinone oxidoreductase subunit C, partial [Methylocystis sp.]